VDPEPANERRLGSLADYRLPGATPPTAAGPRIGVPRNFAIAGVILLAMGAAITWDVLAMKP